jgi:hypothetical protein
LALELRRLAAQQDESLSGKLAKFLDDKKRIAAIVAAAAINGMRSAR